MSQYTVNVTLGNTAITVDATENVIDATVGSVLGVSSSGAVTSVAGRTGVVTLTSADLTDATAAGRALLDDANAAAQRATLGLGTAATSATGDFEASGAVATHAALTSSVHGITAFGASLVDDANASAARTTLGLGTAATSATGDFAAASHTHAASDIASGTVATARLGSGVADGTTYLRGDQTWATVTAGIAGSTGATDNRILRSDGTGGATLQNSAVTCDDSGNLSGIPSITTTPFVIGQTTYSGRTINRLLSDGTNESVVIAPTGTGYFALRVPDGTNVGGNQRGNNSVDLTTRGTAAAWVASGADAFASGVDAQASGVGSFVHSATTSGCSATSSGGISIGASIYNSAANAVGLGSSITIGASGANSFGSGGGHTLSNQIQSAFGWGCSISLYGQMAKSSVQFAAAGDNQWSLCVARRATSDATPSNLFLDGSSSRIVVPANSAGVATIKLVGRTNTAGAGWATAVRQVSWFKGTTSASMTISTVDTIGTDRGSNAGAWPAGWAVAVTADTTNGAIDISVTGAAATNIRWTASIEWQEVTYA